MHARRFGLFRVRSPLLTESLLFSVPAGTEMVHFPALSSLAYVFSQGCLGIDRGGFPHSEISGSTPVCGSPKLIAACHVLHRLLAPRHPPYALSSLTFNPRNRRRRHLRYNRGSPRHKKRESDAAGTTWTHCVCVVGKTTVCRIFSCQRTADAVPRQPSRTAQTTRRKTRRGPPSAGNRLVQPARRPPRKTALVENTGIEPATSWLQTKRSPS